MTLFNPLCINNSLKRGGIVYDKKEREFAEKIYTTLLNPSANIGDQEKILPYRAIHGYGSTDVEM
ncbi:MAG: hypothetical protein Ct9H300mP3_09380 [Gammaproteobacteria bacterium]|nr:MAG: hypothetical protein Ct9H300mP3_09380 [Gammaproteobacteria bacterium]